MNYGTQCKFCKIPITVEIDDSYLAIPADKGPVGPFGDPFKLLKLACCNRCADLREERRAITGKVQRACWVWKWRTKTEQEDLAKMKEHLTGLTQDYAKLIARWHKLDGMIWEEAVVDWMLEKPDKWGEILARLWTMFKQWNKQQELLAQ